MIFTFLAPLLALASVQADGQTNTQAAQQPIDQKSIETLDQLPIEQSTAPRCGVAFAIVSAWQESGDPRGRDYPDMQTEGGREFFVRSIANLMDTSSLSREAVEVLVRREATALNTQEGHKQVQAMMPACLLMKRSRGL